MITHLLRCHLMMEPTAVASWPNIPSVHPVWKLLYSHTKGIMAINTLGRNKLIPDGGLADKVLSIGDGGQITFWKKILMNEVSKIYENSITKTMLYFFGMPFNISLLILLAFITQMTSKFKR